MDTKNRCVTLSQQEHRHCKEDVAFQGRMDDDPKGSVLPRKRSFRFRWCNVRSDTKTEPGRPGGKKRDSTK